MALIRALNSGVSGLKAFQTKMDVIGNNIANVETIGFKSSRVTFSDLLAQRIGRSGAGGESSPQMSNQVGLGVTVSSIDRDFSQGVMHNTGRTTDVAIEGKGFFMVNGSGQNFLTRAGNFSFNKDGFLVDQGGRQVQGYNANANGNILRGGITSDIWVDFEKVFPPKQTDKVILAGNLDANTSRTQTLQAQSSLTTSGGHPATEGTLLNDLTQTITPLVPGDEISFSVILNDGSAQTIDYTYAAGATVEDLMNYFNTQIGAGEGTMQLIDGILTLRSGQLGDSELKIDSITTNGTGAVNIPGFLVSQNGETGTRTMSTTIFDELGRAHSLILDFSQTGENEWSYNARFIDGENILSGAQGTVQFDGQGNLISDSFLNVVFDPGNGAAVSSFEVELGDSSKGTQFTQYAGGNSAKVLLQNGHTQGNLVDMNIDGDGKLLGIYDNGKTMALGQLAIAQVQNEAGLEMIGNGLFTASYSAGEVFISTAADLNGTGVNSGLLEASNVDLAKEFTEMITSQRAYQSSARVISTADEMLIEAVNLKR